VARGFADIFHGILHHPDLGDINIALKQLRRSVDDESKTARRLHREMAVWSKLRHSNVLPFLGSAYTDPHNTLCFVSPWMSNKDIIAYLRMTPGADRVGLLCGVIQGLEYLHTLNPGIVHGDLKGVGT